MKSLLAAVALCLPIAPLHAQHALVLQKLTEWNAAAPIPAADKIVDEIRTLAPRLYGAAPGCAASEIALVKSSPATSERLVFSAIIQQQMRNAWTVTARLPGCDAAPVRFMVMQDTADELSAIRINRGQSHAWESLIGDTLPLARIAAVAALKRKALDCSLDAPAELGVLRVANEDPSLGPDIFGVRYAGSWSEVWPLQICGHSVEVSIDFTADGDAGAYTKVPAERVVVNGA